MRKFKQLPLKGCRLDGWLADIVRKGNKKMVGKNLKNQISSGPMKPREFICIVKLERYNTHEDHSLLIAGDDYNDGTGYERGQWKQQKFLYRAKKTGQYFLATLTSHKPDTQPATVTPLSVDEAITHYEQMFVKRVEPFEKAFPDIKEKIKDM